MMLEKKNKWNFNEESAWTTKLRIWIDIILLNYVCMFGQDIETNFGIAYILHSYQISLGILN